MQYFHRGQRFRRSTGCDRIKDAQDVLRKTLVDIEQQDSSTDTVAGLYAAIEHEYATNGRKSLPHLKSLWKNHLAAYFSVIVAAELTPDQIVEYVRRRRDAGAANASINRELAALKRMYKIALKAQKVKTVPYSRCSRRETFARDSCGTINMKPSRARRERSASGSVRCLSWLTPTDGEKVSSQVCGWHRWTWLNAR